MLPFRKCNSRGYWVQIASANLFLRWESKVSIKVAQEMSPKIQVYSNFTHVRRQLKADISKNIEKIKRKFRFLQINKHFGPRGMALQSSKSLGKSNLHVSKKYLVGDENLIFQQQHCISKLGSNERSWGDGNDCRFCFQISPNFRKNQHSKIVFFFHRFRGPIGC